LYRSPTNSSNLTSTWNPPHAHAQYSLTIPYYTATPNLTPLGRTLDVSLYDMDHYVVPTCPADWLDVRHPMWAAARTTSPP
ncbi:MAG: hypothetical protein M1415_00960, partial [Firmicutes bacterium]|nr:hypothetical protein [Bacillota bacterium]